MNTPAVEITGLVKCYGATTAVNDVDLVVPRGGLLALLGPNGAGKTTTIEICEGFTTPDAGEVRVLGFDPQRQRAKLSPRIGVMPQGGGAYPGIHAEEMLQLVASCAGNPLDVPWLLETLGLRTARRTPFKRLSGGQQQRLSLACALVGRPELVFLDEPTAGMDPQARMLVWELLRALKRDGVTVLLTTHLMEEAEELADQVVIMDHGKVIANGSPNSLTVQTSETAALRFTANAGMDVEQLSLALPQGSIARETSPGSYEVEGEINPRLIASVTAWCAEQGVLAQELTVGRRGLEDVFLELTGRELRA